MDADWYVTEKMIRSRVTEAQARARFAALLGQSNESSRSKSVEGRLVALGRSLANKLRSEFSKARVRCVGRQPRTGHRHAP